MISKTDTRDAILADWRLLMAERDGDVDARARCQQDADDFDMEYDDYVENESLNTVERAVKAGIIEYDAENNGWHEGWTRMLVALDTSACEGL